MAQYHWDPATLALAFSINMGIIPLPMIWGGRMIDNGKGKQAIVIGGILFSLGFILSGFVDNLPMLFLTYGVIAGWDRPAFTGNLNNILKFSLTVAVGQRYRTGGCWRRDATLHPPGRIFYGANSRC